MFQFTETTVVNTMTDSSGLPKYAASTDKSTFIARRVGNFKVANIVNGIVYKNPYSQGILEVATVTIPTVTAGLVVRLYIDVRLEKQTESDYASTHLYFGKPIVVEVIATGTASTDAAALVAQLNNLKTEFGVQDVLASVPSNGTTITFTATTSNQRFYNIQVLAENTNVAYPNSMVQPQYTDVTGGTFSVTTHGSVGFGDDLYMVSSIMLPTMDNTRYFGVSSEERPIPGGNYSQYTFQYLINKDSDDGIVSGLKSLTTQVFYVSAANKDAFETVLTSLGLTLIPAKPGSGSLKLSATDNPFVVGTNSTVSALDAVGTVTYTSGTPAVVTINANTGVATAQAVGTATITATDSTNATGTITLTVVA
jgi:hypothetical protein